MSNNGPYGSADPQGNNAWDLSQTYDNNSPTGFSSSSSSNDKSSYPTIPNGNNNNLFNYARCHHSNHPTLGLQSFEKWLDKWDNSSPGDRNRNWMKDKMLKLMDSVPKLQERKIIRADLKVDNLTKIIKNGPDLSGRTISNNEVIHSTDDITNLLKDIRSYLLGRASTFQAM
ncbi:hypothetical protein WR25_03460 isoform A [Diploscapter pachys]|uniref:Uncharacterized protein n=1 Tax=Diploscapter pachys TaxID=2018661 RepID=A0A2A2J7M8_9BILA|nr:hypothetical protein WR25_03460 isoform A [Diploscapter pachys]